MYKSLDIIQVFLQ